ncbi:MAG: mechanosensitive ion channel family protein [Gemmatimonadetes bacterium]|nr:mechanosensitive ion channel family protein [Gemmatimonadota bacterium]
MRFLIVVFLLLSFIYRQPAAAQESEDTTQTSTDSVAVEQAELTRAREAAQRLTLIGDTLGVLISSSGRTADNEQRELLRLQAIRLVDEMLDLGDDLLDLLRGLDSTQAAVDSIIVSFRAFLTFVIREYDRSVDAYAARLSALRERRPDTEPANMGDLEADIRLAQSRLDTVLVGQMETLAAADSMGLDVAGRWDDLDRFLTTRAESQAGRLMIADGERDRLGAEVRAAVRAGTSEAEVASLRTRQRIAEQRLEGIVSSLRNSAALLDRRGLGTVPYRRVIIEATGEVTSDILDVRVLFGVIGRFVARGWESVKAWAPTFFVQVLIVLGSIFVVRRAFRLVWWVSRRRNRPKLSNLLADLVGRMLGPIATITGVLMGLWFTGANLGTLLAGVGVLGIIIGLALQDSMSNLAAGAFILIYQPYERGDLISAGGVVGKVRSLGLANTSIVTLDNRLLHVPNRKIWSEVIENRSAEKIRRVETIVKVSYREDLATVFSLLLELLKGHEQILEEPEPSVFITELGDPWVSIKVWGWAKRDDWWGITMELPKLIWGRFQAEKIETPLPRWAWPEEKRTAVMPDDDD